MQNLQKKEQKSTFAQQKTDTVLSKEVESMEEIKYKIK